MQERHPTAGRIINAALRLFAERGMEATPIVRIEEAAGLAPGSGAFYKHFRSKGDVIRAARDDMAAQIPYGSAAFETLDELDLSDQLRLIAAGMLATYDARRDLVITGIRLPADHGLFDDESGVSQAGLDWFEAWIERGQVQGSLHVDDARATGVLLLGSIFGYWIGEQLGRQGSIDVSRDRLIDAWTAVALRSLGAGG